MNESFPKRIPIRWFVLTIALMGWSIGLSILSAAFNPARPLEVQPILWLTALLILAGIGFIYLIQTSRLLHTRPSYLYWILAAGILMRLSTLPSTPILEDDFYRYLWDGAVTGNGINPYAYSPEDIRKSLTEGNSLPIPQEVQTLANQPNNTLSNINHPYVRTIYPPITQVAFAVAYWISPWSMTAWRGVLIAVDILNAILLLLLLFRLNLSSLWIGIYWLNPLVVKEIFNSGHMDILVFPFLLMAFLMLFHKKHLIAILFLAVAVGVKLWPLALLPIFLRPVLPDTKRATGLALLFGATVLILLSPMLLTAGDANAGLNVYSQRWELNDAAFRLIVLIWSQVLPLFSIHPGHSQWLARISIIILFFLWMVFILRKKTEHFSEIIDQALLITAGIFLLSPTQFPWYGVWMMPFLAIVPRRSLLLLTVLLPLYYLWYYFRVLDEVGIFHNGIVWIEFLPIWILLINEIRTNKGRTLPAYSEVFVKHEKSL